MACVGAPATDGGDDGAVLIALDVETGRPRWRRSLEGYLQRVAAAPDGLYSFDASGSDITYNGSKLN